MKTIPGIEKIFVEKGAENHLITKNLLQSYPFIKPEIISNSNLAFKDLSAISTDPVGKGKKRIWVGLQNGSFLKKCPGTKNMLCCNYYVLNIATQCILNCAYCILQEYFQNNPVLKVFCNIKDCFSETDNLIHSRPNGVFRIGTGEYTDSLALDRVTGFSNELIPYFKNKKNLILELKTKTTEISNLLRHKGSKNIVIAWSLNPDPIIRSEEEGASSLKERLEAARECMQNGYKLAFHFDPIILYQGWEKDYKKTVVKLFESINPDSITWISLGGFRYRPALKEIMRERFPESRLLTGEHVLCEDGKMRYLKSLRVEAYGKIANWIKSHGPTIRVYLCMESREIWQKVFRKIPMCEGKDDLLFDNE